MKVKYIKLLITIILIFFISCKDENPLAITSNIFNTQENSINHLKLDILSSNSRLMHSEILNFTSDSIAVKLNIVGLEEGSGSGDVHLYSGSTTFTAFYFNRDTLITDTLITDALFDEPLDRAAITLKNFTGSFIFEMDGI